jgi:hypothetical protein
LDAVGAGGDRARRARLQNFQRLENRTEKTAMNELVKKDGIAEKIYLIRGVQVMLDRDLAELYGVGTKVFNQAVKRNIARFPREFRFQILDDEFTNLRSQIVTSSVVSQLVTPDGEADLRSVTGSVR